MQTLLIGVAGLLAVGTTIGAQQENTVPSAKESKASAQPAPSLSRYDGDNPNSRKVEKSPRESEEGIKVHGHWVIVVRNPDGSLAAHREFENSLVNQQVLANLLSKGASMGFWSVEIASQQTGGGGPCTNIVSATADSPCVIAETNGYGPSDSTEPVTQTLTLTPNGGSLQMQGHVTAQRDGHIFKVATAITTCDPSVAPTSACPQNSAGSKYEIFSMAGINPVDVTSGQTIDITVTFSFS